MFPRRPPVLRTRWCALTPPLALCATALLLSACGGGDNAPPPVAYTGVVADGPLQGVTVCHDQNDNGACDAGEPTALTDADGQYRFEVDAATAGKFAVLALVPASAVDKDTGAAIGAALVLTAPPSGSSGAQAVFVSPLTTVVAGVVQDSGKTLAEATAQVQAQLGLAVSPLGDYTAAGAPAELALAARAVGTVMVETTRLAADAGVPAAAAARLVREASHQQLTVLAAALASSTADSPAGRARAAAEAATAALNLSPATVKAVAEQLSKPAGPADVRGPFISVRRFSYTGANHYSYVLFTGDSSLQAADGSFTAHDVRGNVSAGNPIAYSRNQMYWTGSAWQVCNDQWQVITGVQLATASKPQTSTYCGASRAEGRSVNEEIAGQTLRAVLTRMRAYPLRDSAGSTTDSTGLPVNWGPKPELLPADAVFPAGAMLSTRSTSGDIGSTDRIELAAKSTVRWPDGVYRQATRLAQYSGMPGNLADAAVLPTPANTVFVADLPLAEQPDATLEPTQRWRAGLDVAALKIRFYQCEIRKADQANLNCRPAGDGSLALGTQGDIRLMRVASGYPAVLLDRLAQQRFWAEHAGTVFRGVTDLPRTRYDQRLNMAAWDALRAALGIPAHTVPSAPLVSGPFESLRYFSFTDAGNYRWQSLSGDSSQLDANGDYAVSENRKRLSRGVDRPFVRTASYWTGSEWTSCPSSGAVISVKGAAPNRSVRCRAYVDEPVSSTTLSLGGRLMRDVVNDIRAYGSRDRVDSDGFIFSTGFGTWGPDPAAHPQLATATFPAGSTMEYRSTRAVAVPSLTIYPDAAYHLRVAPSPYTGSDPGAWPFATTLDEMVAKYPGGLASGAVAVDTSYAFGYTADTGVDAAHPGQAQIRLAFDAKGNKARFFYTDELYAGGPVTNVTTALDTTYRIETVNGVRTLTLAAVPAGFAGSVPVFAERSDGIWRAFPEILPTEPTWSIRLNGSAGAALRAALGIR